MKLTIETNRLILRPFEISDAKDMYEGWASDEEVTKYLTWGAHKSIDDTKSILSLWVKEYEKEERINFAIVLKETNELIGGIDVVGYLEEIPVIGYVLSRKYWNKGIMSEVLQRVKEFLFSLGHNKIIIDAVEENIGSNRVIQKCGGVFQESYPDILKYSNKTVNINRYFILKKNEI